MLKIISLLLPHFLQVRVYIGHGKISPSVPCGAFAETAQLGLEYVICVSEALVLIVNWCTFFSSMWSLYMACLSSWTARTSLPLERMKKMNGLFKVWAYEFRISPLSYCISQSQLQG